MSNQQLNEECRLTHDITSDSRQYAYNAVYRAQMDYGDKLPWQMERDIFHEALHKYESENPDKIAP